MDGCTQLSHIDQIFMTFIDVRQCRLSGISEQEFLLPDQVEKVQREEAGSPDLKSYFCFSRSSKAQEVTCKCIHNSEG